MKRAFLLFCTLLVAVCHADEAESPEVLDGPQCRSDNLCYGKFGGADDTYMQGYLQALVDLHFNEQCVNVCVKGGTVYVSNLPNNSLISRSIVRFLADFPGVECVVIDQHCTICKHVDHPTPWYDCCKIGGIWFPQANELFQPLIADPRQVKFAGEWRFHDSVIGSRVGAAIFGDTFPIFRWLSVGPWCGDLQFAIDAGVWAIFKFGDPRLGGGSSDRVALINTDFLCSLTWTYAAGCWSSRFRYYHISSHLGDEYLVSIPDVVRINPSREAVDFFLSYQIIDALRLYGGIGINIRSDESFRVDPFYFEGGAELRLLGQRNLFQCLYLQPFLAMDFRVWQDLRWRPDATFMLGLELSKLQGLGRKARIYIQYHDGYSFEGQFSKLRTEYVALGFSWGF
jgi:Protein of unknown function (DUF1207)